MGTRDYKNFAQDEIYHLYNRGVNKRKIFRNKEDYQFFMDRLSENLFPHMEKVATKSTRRKFLPAGCFDLICFCLMPNHFHLVLRQNTEVPLSVLVHKVLTGYVKYFNKKYNRVGGLFQDQVKSVHVETNEQLMWLSGYVHSNPSVAKLVRYDKEYQWSSYGAYMQYLKKNDNKTYPHICKSDIILDQCKSKKEYESIVNDARSAIIKKKWQLSGTELLLDF